MADPRDLYRPDTTQQFRPDATGTITPNATPPSLNVVPGLMPEKSVTDQGMQALQSFMPALDQYMAKQEKQYSEDELQRGREAALKQAMEYGDAVRQGKLAPNQSKWFMKGYKAQYGEALGQTWNAEAKAAWMGSDAKNSDDPNAAANFLRDFTAKKLSTAAGMDPDVRAGLLPQLSNMHASIMAAQAEYSAKQTYDNNLTVLGTNIASDIDAFLNSHGTMSQAELFAKIKQRDAAGRLQGVSNDDMNQLVAQAFAQKAREAGSTALLNVVKQYPTVGNNPKFLGVIRGAQDAIENKALARANLAMAQEARMIRINGQRALMNAVDQLVAQKAAGVEPHITNDMLATFKASGNPEAFMSGLKFAQEQRQEFEKPTPQETATVLGRVLNAGPNGALDEFNVMMGEGLIKGTQFAGTVAGWVKQVHDEHIQSSKPYTEGTSRIKSLANAAEMGKAMINPDAVNEAVSGFQHDFVIWRASHPAATDTEVDAVKNDMIARYTEQLNEFKMMGDHAGEWKPGAIKETPESSLTGTYQPFHHQSTDDLIKMLGPNAGSVTQPYGQGTIRKTPMKPNQKP